jgi:hypothetical protein
MDERNPASLAVARCWGMGSNSLKALVNAFDNDQHGAWLKLLVPEIEIQIVYYAVEVPWGFQLRFHGRPVNNEESCYVGNLAFCQAKIEQFPLYTLRHTCDSVGTTHGPVDVSAPRRAPRRGHHEALHSSARAHDSGSNETGKCSRRWAQCSNGKSLPPGNHELN